MNKAQVNGMRGQSRTWSSTIVDIQFFSECVANSVTIYNPHLIVAYYTQYGCPLYWNLDFSVPIIANEFTYPNTQSLPFDAMNYASNYAYTPFSTLTQVKQGGGALPQPPSPTSPITLSNYDLAPVPELFYYWYKIIDPQQSEGRSSLGVYGQNVLLKGTSFHDEVGTQAVTSINNNFSSFSAFNFIDMLDESYCDISKYFVYNQTTTWGGVVRTLDAGIWSTWENFYPETRIQIMYLDRGHGFEFERTLVP